MDNVVIDNTVTIDGHHVYIYICMHIHTCVLYIIPKLIVNSFRCDIDSDKSGIGI